MKKNDNVKVIGPYRTGDTGTIKKPVSKIPDEYGEVMDGDWYVESKTGVTCNFFEKELEVLKE